MIWLIFAASISCGVTGTVLLKQSNGLALWHYAGLAVLSYGVSMLLLSQVLKNLPLGVVYAIWAGAGIITSLFLDQVLFRDEKTFWQYMFIALILVGSIGLGLVTKVKA